ncbi:LPXTG cell wall anchor domain-containing protein [Enterococcus canintestini]|uniref:Gram-positive cocci surface proteins LPxTG domain-containing protein n=1 Tax=Enterococcus canintestini TaxID=317010 RepID=A0A267HUX9_9ENTE|nr:LPXTG cell wall anchor domain-containing protein [Enterococcus canintestini]PAB01380.1 hypothetical protein AKL21_05085 [Enterococcus canintestini]
MKKNNKRLKKFLCACIIFFCLSGYAPSVRAATVSDHDQNSSVIELYKGNSADDQISNPSSKHGSYPQTGELKTMGYSFLGTTVVLLVLITFFKKRRQLDEEN